MKFLRILLDKKWKTWRKGNIKYLCPMLSIANYSLNWMDPITEFDSDVLYSGKKIS